MILLPAIAYFIIVKYAPIYGVQLAFKDFRVNKGITGSPWVGLEHFKFILIEETFWNAFKNTIIIAFMKIILAFPIPIILAIMINEVKGNAYKRTLQTIFTFPHFLSWVVLSGIVINILSGSGAVNNLIAQFGGQKINFLMDNRLFRFLLVFSESWKEAGWSSIMYLAAITSIPNELFDAATIDGAGRFQKIRFIIWPGIHFMVIVLLILKIGHTMDSGFMQVLNLYNPSVYKTGDIIDTYVYRITFEKLPDFGFSTAVGLFKGIVNLILLFSSNGIAKIFKQEGIY